MTRCLALRGGCVSQAVNFTYVNHDHSLCAPNCNTVVHTRYHGHHCGARDQLRWDSLDTPDTTFPPGACAWNSSNAPEYTGTGCGVAPTTGSSPNTCGMNVTAHVPMIFCPPSGFTLEAAGGGWAGGASHGPLSVEGCAAACLGAAGCSAFSVSDGAGCETYHGQLQGFTAVRSPLLARSARRLCDRIPLPFVQLGALRSTRSSRQSARLQRSAPCCRSRICDCVSSLAADVAGGCVWQRANTSAYLRAAAHNASKPPPSHPIRLKNWQALRPSTGAQPVSRARS